MSDPTMPDHPVKVTVERHDEPTTHHEMVGDDWFLVMCGRYEATSVSRYPNGTVSLTLKVVGS